MPRRKGSEDISEEDEGDRSRKNPRRGAKTVSYKEDNAEDDPMDVDAAEEEEENPVSSSSDDEEPIGNLRPSRAAAAKGKKTEKENMGDDTQRRTSSRATKFKGGMKEPSEGIRDLLLRDTTTTTTKGNKARRKQSFDDDEDDDSDMEETFKTPKKAKRQSNKRQVQRNNKKMESPHKAPARRNKQTRLTIKNHTTLPDQSEDESSEESEVEDDDDEEEEEPFKIQRIIASRTETKVKWREICQKMNTTEIDDGSRWMQDPVEDGDDTVEERFLVKWDDISYLHCSWETESDLLDQVQGAKTYLATFFRKSHHGYLFDADERCDGDFFDPAWMQIDRILEEQYPETCPIKNVKDEDKISNKELGIILDKNDPEYENGLGREFLVKWGNQAYQDGTYEFERDLIANDIEYKDQLNQYKRRTKKLTVDKAKKLQKEGEAELKRLYKYLFGDKSDSKEEDGVEEYQKKLQENVFKNGGQLRDYQSVGVSWLISNLVNKRSCILADEMGLGKTLQTVSFINLIATQLKRRGPFLIIAPLSTLAHWQREFMGWTDLNTIVYHGSAKDRDIIRELEFVHESDRPKGGIGLNQLYLRKCKPKKGGSVGNHWMTEVVITTPELLTADDFVELTAVRWQCLVVDEAQKLKNYNSKLATNLRDSRFEFCHKLLLTGTPIQNSMEELFALLNFIDPVLFPDCDQFMEKYGDIKSKDKIDQLHEEIRPYILRRLKEDAEKSVPPKEETVIEVELTAAQKQYYRALYEKNVKFLHKDKKKALDGPSLNNLAMQLRKCCNHLFLLNGIEETFRESQKAEGLSLSDGDLLVKASGKLVLLDKLLPRLKENGHRILIFSQFSMTLDLLEDYLTHRVFKFERIDGSITGKKRQQAIDRFQAPGVEGKEQPFIMLLTTRAGGVGINLTAADTCIIFDSDWNPQNDLQAQARCHRIGQTKNVKVFRLLTRNTYELQMFHMSSMKMGLDQAVLSGFEGGKEGTGTLSKDEVEKLLRHGAYGIFSEDKDGVEESNAFVDQDIDTILERRSRKVVHENTGSGSSAAGGTFSKARFSAPKGAEGKKGEKEDVDIDDPDFWRKMVGEGQDDVDEDDLAGKRRKRTVTNYAEGIYEKKVEQSLLTSDAEVDDDDDDDSEDDESYASGDDGDQQERFRWGGKKSSQWKIEEAKKLLNVLQAHGYGNIAWSRFVQEVASKISHSEKEVRRMCWSILLVALCELAEEDASNTRRRAVRAAEKKREAENDGSSPPVHGGVLAGTQNAPSAEEIEALIQKCFDKQWASNSSWASRAMKDALQFAKEGQPRPDEMLSRVLRTAASSSSKSHHQDEITTQFVRTVWPSLKNRGWQAKVIADGPNAGKTQYSYEEKQYYSPEAVLAAAGTIHAELSKLVESLQQKVESTRLKSKESEAKLREKHLAMKAGTIHVKDLVEFLNKYAPLQLLFDRKHNKKLSLTARKLMHACNYMHTATTLVKNAEATRGTSPLVDHLSKILVVDKKQGLPHPLWSLRHDAVLIHAIAKHGWIDNDSSCRRLINDSEITWGFPFDSEASNESDTGSKTSQKADLIKSLRETASRAAELFNLHQDTLEEVKTFNQSLIVRTYSLVQVTPEENENEAEPDVQRKPKWAVDDDALVASTGLDSSESQDVELPPKRELAKRIKNVLSKNVGNSGSRGASSDIMRVDSKSESNEFPVIDQSDRCNILLAEILVAIVKAKAQKGMNLLCSLGCAEAKKRKEAIQEKADTSTDETKKKKFAKAAEEMDGINKGIGLAKSALKQSRQAKNVLRVMIGQDVVRHIKDPVYPVQGPSRGTGASQKQRQNANGTKSKKEESAIGDRALTRAITKCYDKNGGGPGRVSPEGHVSDLELTAIETLIISVVCSQGLPVWTEDMSMLLTVDNDNKSMEDSSKSNLELTWIGFGSILATAAKDWHDSASRKVEECQQDYEKHQDKDDESQSKTRARKALANAIRIADVKETAAAQAAEYANDSSILAQKTIMLIERLRRKMGSAAGGHNKSAKKANTGLGPKCFDFLASQLSQWANALEIVDGKGDTLAYTAADFYHDLPDEERDHVEVTATLNKLDCRHLLIQITSVSRLRSLFMKYTKEDLLGKIDRAATNSKTNDSWESQPDWWRLAESPSHHDALLVESIVEFGYTGVLENARGFGPPDKVNEQASLKDLGLNKVIIQHRVNQLARELHEIERNADTLRMLDQRREKANAGGAKKEKKTTGANENKGGKKQSAIEVYFAKTANPKKAGSAVVLSDTEDDFATKNIRSPVDPPAGGVAVVEIDASPRPKHSDEDVAMEEAVDNTVAGEKREIDDASASDSPASPEKKLRSS